MLKSNNPLIQYITDFLEYCEIEKGLSQSSIKSYDRFINIFKTWLINNDLKDLNPRQLTPDHIWKYRVYLSRYLNPHTKRGLKKSTQSFYLIALRNFLSFLADKDIQTLSIDKVKLPKDSKKDRIVKFLNLKQLKKLFDMPNIETKIGLRDKAILEVLFSTGLRVSELVSLNRNQINLKNIDKMDNYELNIVGKGDRSRTVYFSQRALHWLKKYLDARTDNNDKALFVNYRLHKKDTERRLTVRSIERLVNKYAKMAGLPVLTTPHVLRHTYATDLLNQGVDLRIIQEFLGHKNIVTTQIYTHVTNRKLKDIHKSCHSGNKLT